MKKSIISILLIITLTTSIAYSVSNLGTIKGKVISNGIGIRDADIVLINEDMETLITSTDKEGYYSFNDLPYGKYLITAKINGKFYLQYIIRK